MTPFVFMGTPEFSTLVLDRLEEANFLPVLIVTQPDRPCGRGKKLKPSPVAIWAEEREVLTLKPADCRDQAFIGKLKELAPVFILTAAFGQILPLSILEIPERGCLNLHASLLPRYRGPSPIQTALLNGDRETGVSLMLMDEGLDTGPVIAQRRMALSDSLDAGELNLALARLGGELIADSICPYLAGKLIPEPQDEGRATITRLLKKADGQVDFDQPAQMVHNHIRAMNPWPGAFAFLDGKRYKLLRAKVFQNSMDRGIPGRLRLIGKRMIILCREGAVEILEIQAESGSPMSCVTCSHNFTEGAVFGPPATK
ncbi:MAG TPA: methionyl-tRNA formyltransferase [Bacillota bacterium]|nr:methionyl-tRNA formyltransferase [Fastidiosipila sp.]HPX93813.1 methionyl-tRNA formyltransferase [Bacillota bacterium]HQB81638.1 methionyl-tRNA formyltransferase [Bacillota bacterium]